MQVADELVKELTESEKRGATSEVSMYYWLIALHCI